VSKSRFKKKREEGDNIVNNAHEAKIQTNQLK
jgi:hypothetical protein